MTSLHFRAFAFLPILLILPLFFFTAPTKAEAVTWILAESRVDVEYIVEDGDYLEPGYWRERDTSSPESADRYTDPPYDIIVDTWDDDSNHDAWGYEGWPLTGHIFVPSGSTNTFFMSGFFRITGMVFSANTDKYIYEPGESVTIFGVSEGGAGALGGALSYTQIRASLAGSGIWDEIVYDRRCYGGKGGGLFPSSWYYCNPPSPTSATLFAPVTPGLYQIDLVGEISDGRETRRARTAVEIEVAAPPPPAQPILSVSPDIDFGTVPVGETRTNAFTVSNAGSGDLSGNVAFSPAARTLAEMENNKRNNTNVALAASAQNTGASTADSWLSLLAAISLLTALLILLRTLARKLR